MTWRWPEWPPPALPFNSAGKSRLFNSGGCRIAPRQEDGRIYLTYFLAKLWLRHCDIRRLTPLTFNSNSLCLVAELEHRAERHLNKSELRSNPVC